MFPRMGFLAVGEDGLILRVGGKAREHDKPFAPGVKRENTTAASI